MNLLRVNMSEHQVHRVPVPPVFEQLGGRALIARLLLDEIPPTCDALGPQNKLIFSPGLLGGDFRYYDTIYEERYMGLPADNVEGYRLGSPLTDASRLKANLLIVHGTGDDNVHYQGTEALINELISFKKRFTIMAYPNRTHGISEAAEELAQYISRELSEAQQA